MQCISLRKVVQSAESCSVCGWVLCRQTVDQRKLLARQTLSLRKVVQSTAQYHAVRLQIHEIPSAMDSQSAESTDQRNSYCAVRSKSQPTVLFQQTLHCTVQFHQSKSEVWYQSVGLIDHRHSAPHMRSTVQAK